MTTYKGLKGTKIQNVTSDAISSQMVGGSWASGGNVNNARYSCQGFGTQTGIAKRHGISRVTLWQIAKENDWIYGSDRQKSLQKYNEISTLRLNESRVDAVEQHAIELSAIWEKINDISTIEDAELLEKQADILIKCIKGERISYGLPNDFKHLETRSESVIRVEDMLKTLEAKREDLNDAEYEMIEGGGASAPRT